MCDACGLRLTRRRALALAGGTVVAAAGGFSRTARARAPGAPAIQPRSTWAGDSRPPVGELRGEEVRFLLVHHTASPNGADPIGTLRGVYDFHTSAEKGWPDVAYNFLIDQNGVVYEGRFGSLAGPVEASATGGSQGFAQLVCLLGDFTSQNPTAAALASLNSTLAWLADRYSIDTSEGAQTTFVSRGSNRWPAGTSVTASTISGHRDMSQTACPGDTFYPYLVANVRREVDARRTSGTATPTTATPTTATPSTATPPATTSATTTAAEPAPGTSAPQPASSAAAETAASTPATNPTTSGAESSTTIAAGGVGSTVPVPSDAPLGDRSADAVTELVDSTGRDSSNGTALAVAAGAGAVALAGALFVGVHSRSSGSDRGAGDESVDPPGAGSDPLV